jgi:AP-3 complex subunit delta-1
LRSSIPLEVAVALNGLSHIATPDLAQHLAPDVITLLTHSRPAIRKKALLVLYSIIIHYPAALEQSLPRLREKLEDDDVGVVSAAINIICELSRNNTTNAKLFLAFSPQFFDLLTSSTNNWMIIKIIKLFGVLTPLEPRLVKKLVPPISKLISTTPAMSLLYECIHTIIIGKMLIGPEGDALATTCVEKLATFLDDEDQNLKYIALLALVKIIPTHPHLVALHQEQIFDSMEDDDLSIRLRALDLVSGMAGRQNYRVIVEHQLKHLKPGQASRQTSAAASLKLALQGSQRDGTSSGSWLSASYKSEIINRILNLGSLETYSNIIDFEWYVDVLIELAYLANNTAGPRVQFQLIDITSRVRAVRPHAISKLKQVLEDDAILEDAQKDEFHLIRAAAWICGEYCQDVPYPPAIISLLLRRELLEKCRPMTVYVLLHNAVKLFAWWLLQLSKEWKDDRLSDVKPLTREVSEALQYLAKTSKDAEVEERAAEYCQLFLLLEKDLDSYKPGKGNGKDSTTTKEESNWNGEVAVNADKAGPKSLLLLSPLFFTYALGPVAKKAQGKVIVPAELDPEEWIVDPEEVQIIDPWKEEKVATNAKEKSRKAGTNGTRSSLENGKSTETSQAEAKERARLKAERLKRQQESPFYIGSRVNQRQDEQEVDIDEIPIVELQLDDVLRPTTAKRTSTAAAPAQTTYVQEEEEAPEEESRPEVVKKVVGSRKKKKKTKAVEEASLM